MILLLIPFFLGAAVYAFRGLRTQLACTVAAAVITSATVLVQEVIPLGGFSHHGNTWQGYVLIVLGPYFLVFGVLSLLRLLDPAESMAKPLVVAVSVPLSYWFGIFFFVSTAASTGLAVE